MNGGDVGYGVLFKEIQIEEVKKEDGPEVSNESNEQSDEKSSEQSNEQSNEQPTQQPSQQPSQQPPQPTQPTQRSKSVIKTIIPIHRVDPVKEDIRYIIILFNKK